MLVPLLAATDGSDLTRSGTDDPADEQDETVSAGDPSPSDLPPEELPEYAPPPESPVPFPEEPPGAPIEPATPEPEIPETDPAEPDPPTPVASEAVALVPSVSDPDAATPEPDAVQEAMRGTEAPAAEVEPKPEKRSPVQRFALAVLLIAAAALIGYAVSRPSTTDGDLDTLARSVEAARSLQFVLDTEDVREARRFVRNEFGWRVGVPVFGSRASLRGLAVAEVAPAVEVPVFLYANGDNREVAVFVYSYALLDQVPSRLTFSRPDFDALAAADPVVRRIDKTELVLWRDRDDIYVAVTDLPAPLLTQGLTMAR